MDRIVRDELERRRIIELTYDYAGGIDHRDWERLRSCFLDEVRFDTSSWSGVPARTLPADAWVAAVRETNGGFDATQHLIANHVVELLGDADARLTAEVRAQHWFDPETLDALGADHLAPSFDLGGHYTAALRRDGERWRVAEWTLTVRWRQGDAALFALARQRGAAA